MATWNEQQLAKARDRVDKLGGLKSMNIDGTSFTLDDLLAQVDKFEKRVLKEKRRVGVISSIKMKRF